MLAVTILIQQLTIGLLFTLHLFGCGEAKKSSDITKVKLKLIYEVIPEDFERNLYYVDWQDTLGKSEGYLPENILKRPKEIWCVITNKNNDTLGYYKGLSMAQKSAYFQTKDTIVILYFKTGLNIFSDKFDNDKEGEEYWNANRIPVEFEPVYLNIKTDLRKKFEIELKEK